MSQTFSKKKLQVANSTLVNFFEMKKISFQKKNTSVGFNWCFDAILVFFLEMEIFSFPPKIISVGSSAFQKKLQQLD